jgi:Asp/Glu/hydantoin racemase
MIVNVKGGRHHYGQAVGILTLDTQFPRIPGDIGNASTFNFPVRLSVVKDATIPRVVKRTDFALLKPFIEAAKELEAEGVRAITTSCGFLSIFQDELASAVKVPVITSSLLLVPMVHRMLGKGERVGVITANSDTLSEEHLRGAGIDPGTIRVTGLQKMPEFSKIDNDELEFDPSIVEKEVVQAATYLQKFGDVRAIVLECANLPPYSKAVYEATKLPVFDIIHVVNMVYQAAVVRDRFVSGFI